MRKELGSEYWKWEEYSWKSEHLKIHKGSIVTAGVDVGSVSSQYVLLVEGELYCYSIVRSGSSSPESANRAMNAALDGSGVDGQDIDFTIGTGYGRVRVPYADKVLTEIACHAKGASVLSGGNVRTIVDIGGQDCKVINCDESGRVTNFLMNDKCAAGTGRGLEIVAEMISVPLPEIGELSLDVPNEDEVPSVSDTCVVFARSGIMELRQDGRSNSEVLAAYAKAMVSRTVFLVRRAELIEPVTMTGGVAKNVGIRKRLAKALDVEIELLEPDPMIAGALGAAVYGWEIVQKRKKEAHSHNDQAGTYS